MVETYEFQSMLFRNAREVADAIVSEWMTAAGSNNDAAVAVILGDYPSDEMAADEITQDFGLNEPVEIDFNEGRTVTAPWLETRGLDRNALIEAVARFRAQRLAA